jgi:hypothetical protein
MGLGQYKHATRNIEVEVLRIGEGWSGPWVEFRVLTFDNDERRPQMLDRTDVLQANHFDLLFQPMATKEER